MSSDGDDFRRIRYDQKRWKRGTDFTHCCRAWFAQSRFHRAPDALGSHRVGTALDGLSWFMSGLQHLGCFDLLQIGCLIRYDLLHLLAGTKLGGARFWVLFVTVARTVALFFTESCHE